MANSDKRYSLGYAFTLSDICSNFSLKKLKINCKQCEQVIGDRHRDILAKKIFVAHFKLVLDDIIDNNVTFWLPLKREKRSNIHIKRFQGEIYQKLRKAGKWKELDILKSNFSGYQMSFYMMGRRTPRVKSIYLNKEYKERITNNVNNGMQYGDSKYDKTVKDYYQQMYNMFPLVPEVDIRRILNFFWKSLYLHNSYGGDVLIKNSGIWCYFGQLTKDPIQHFNYYVQKLTVKLRVLYKRKGFSWDGYYYFALTDKQYQDYLSQKNHRGRPKKYFTFGPVFMYQILDECKIKECYRKYIFRMPYNIYMNYKFFIRNLVTDKAELIIQRDSLKFKDILVYNNDYEVL